MGMGPKYSMVDHSGEKAVNQPETKREKPPNDRRVMRVCSQSGGNQDRRQNERYKKRKIICQFAALQKVRSEKKRARAINERRASMRFADQPVIILL